MNAPPPLSEPPGRLGRPGGLALLLLGCLALLWTGVSLQKVWSADVWWQLRIGEWILEHGAIPRSEMFSHTARGTVLHEVRWGWCVLIASLWHHVGPWALSVVQWLLVGLAWVLIAWPSRLLLLGAGRHAASSALILGLGLVGGSMRWTTRPELVTFVMVGAFLLVLGKALEDDGTSNGRGPRQWLLWILPVLQVLWSNTHSTFVFGPLLCACVTLGALATMLQRRAQAGPAPEAGLGLPLLKRLGIITLLVIAACFVNPFFHHGAMYAVEVFRQTRADSPIASTIVELRSPLAIPLRDWGPDLFAAALLMLVGAATFLRLPVRSTRWWIVRAGLMSLGAYLFLAMQRNTGLACLLVAWVALWNLRSASVMASRTAPAHRPLGLPTGLALAGLVLATAWWFASDRVSVRWGIPREFGSGIVEWNQPRGSAAFLQQAGPRPQLFNIVRDGSYFTWALRDTLPVFIDGRTDAYPPELFALIAGIRPQDWDAMAAHFGINVVVLPNTTYDDVIRHLLASPAWALVHLDHTSLVFVRRIPEHAALLARFPPISPAEPWQPRGPEPDDTPPAWKASIGGVGRPWFTRGMAQSFLAIGSLENARGYLLRARDRFPDDARTLAMLTDVEQMLATQGPRMQADALLKAGQFAQAVPLLEQALVASPSDEALRLALADARFQAQDWAGARRDYEAILANPSQRTSNEYNKLGSACEQLGDLDAAARAFESSLALDPAQAGVWNMLGGVRGKAGKLDEAQRAFEQALELRPDFAQAQRNLEKIRAMRR